MSSGASGLASRAEVKKDTRRNTAVERARGRTRRMRIPTPVNMFARDPGTGASKTIDSRDEIPRQKKAIREVTDGVFGRRAASWGGSDSMTSKSGNAISSFRDTRVKENALRENKIARSRKGEAGTDERTGGMK